MSDIAIKFENISKQYRLGLVGTGTISHDLNRWWHRVRGLEDPYLKIGETNDRSAKATSQYVWALKDISFDVKQGEVLGIIGKNGAGKSTLLKILSRVTAPTTGSIKAIGRIASLLEVGTGFHPEMTGRENIYMNGAIMGMTKSEITRKLDEIVDFAGVEKYIDTPVKRYSSGMTVRLGFAIAAHLEPEILVVDEVLAVGDAEFQKKAIGKMQDVSRGEGRTVLFVSHNMVAVRNLTTKCVLLANGELLHSGNTDDIVNLYIKENLQQNLKTSYFENDRLDDSKPIQLLSAQIEKRDDEFIYIKVKYITRKKVGCAIGLKITNSVDLSLVTLIDTDNESVSFNKTEGESEVIFKYPISNHIPDDFFITISFSDMKSERFDFHEKVLSYSIDELEDPLNNKKRGSIMRSQRNWIITP